MMPRRFHIGQAVNVIMSDGSKRPGEVFGTEPGENLRPPIYGKAYIVEMEEPPPRCVTVGADRLEAVDG